MSPSNIPIVKLTIFVLTTFLAGLMLTLPLYKFDINRLKKTSLFIKILLWLPIYIVFAAILYVNTLLKLLGLAAIIMFSVIEFATTTRKLGYKWPLVVYFTFFVVGMSHFVLLYLVYPKIFISLLISIALSTVMSDVFAFFAGKYLGRHKLPKTLNSNKSWEGVAGQVLGGLVGVAAINTFVASVVSIWMFIPIGIGCAIGDLANSYAKRVANVKDWGRAIPGHGGFLDRFSSMAGSVTFTFYFLLLMLM
jgi:CDP-diglyceride synthetase